MFELVTDLQVKLDLEQALRGQGVDPAKASALITRVAESVLDEANALLKPAAIYGWLPVEDFQHERITFPGGSFSGPLVARAFAGASRLYLALCTIGPDLEKRVAELMAGDMMQAMALDGAGTAAVSEVSRQVRERIAASAEKEGLSAGMHANPGQEGWPIEQQRIIFSLVPAEKIGMRLTESCLMLPRKSVSFVIGCGEKMSAGNVPCDFCSKRDRCQWRNR
ncbi:MAG: hypothetical protein GX890_00665 [Firmicutes bacterium]|jgi:hypothetical protein|nr:hypothetical protein [Bacillota bacterium]HPU00823.1 vitamin B12 dependent-methionine synthase activation domain-containing protein [Bacillota bacterium]